MKKFLVSLLAVVVLFTATVPKQGASADGLTLAAIAGGAYAIAAASGLDLGFTQYDGLGVSQWMQNRINSWLAGRTIAEAFGSELIRLSAGKLLIPSAAVAGIVQFLSDFKSSNKLNENASSPKTVSVGEINGQNIYPNTSSLDPTYPLSPFVNGGTPSWGLYSEAPNEYGKAYVFKCYGVNGQEIATVNYADSATVKLTPRGYNIIQHSATAVQVRLFIRRVSGNSERWITEIQYVTVGNAFSGDVTAQIPGAYSPPQGLNDLQSWEGTVANAPDTNIEDLLGDIFDQSAAGTLDVTGQVVDTPAEPEVTPVPTAAPGDILGGLDTISGQLEGIDNTLTGVQEGVGEAVGQLEGINEGVGSISEALEVPTASEAPAFKFDLTTLFPFCIPFDIYRFVTMFSASPVAPHVQIPFNIPAVGLQYTFDLDFSSFDSVASVLRSVELIAFCVGLAILTSKVIRW